jgi:small subunit ribosomal protein S20
VAHSLSAKKRVRQNVKKHTINRARKSQVKTVIKQLETAISGGNVEQAKGLLVKVSKTLDKTATTSTMHKNTVARKKSRLAKRINSLTTKKA